MWHGIATVVYWNAGSRTTTFVSASKLTAAVSAMDIATTGTMLVYVTNPGGTEIYMNEPEQKFYYRGFHCDPVVARIPAWAEGVSTSPVLHPSFESWGPRPCENWAGRKTLMATMRAASGRA